MALIKQSSTYTRMFFMVDSSDHVSAKTGLSPTVNISKAGGSFASAGGTVSEVGSGWYKIALTTTDTNTLGDLAFQCTASGADPTSFVDQVVAFNPLDGNMGLSEVTADITKVDGTALSTHGSGYLPADLRQIAGSAVSTSSAQLGVNVVQVGGTTQTARDLGAQCDATISSRAPASTALSNATWTDAKAGYLDAAISSRSTLTAADVWGYASRTLTSFGTLVSDIWNHATRTLTGFSTALAVSVWDVLESAISTANSIGLKVKTNLDAQVSTRSTLGSSDVAGAVWNAARSSYNSAGTFGQGVASVQGNVTGSVGSVSSGVTVSTNNDKTGYSLADGAITSAKFASGAITSSAIASDAIGSSQFAQAAADKVWASSSRSLTDKAGFELSNTAMDAVWDRPSYLGSITFETLIGRSYQMINNKMIVNESTGAVVIRNIGDTADIATGSVVSASGSVTRAELSW